MDMKIFIVSMGLGRLFQYALIIFGVEIIAKLLPFSI
jgi:hypothetical protein